MPSYVPTIGSGDAIAAQSVYNLKNHHDWLVANGQSGKGIITEIGIPGSSNPGTDPIAGSGTNATYDPGWESTLQQVYEHMNLWGYSTTAWNASEWAVDLRAYRTDDGNNKALNYRTTASSVIENNPGNGTYFRGVNYAGGEFSDRGPNGSLDRSHLSQPNAGYYYPTPASFPILFARGVVLIRVPVRWERLQPTLKQALDATEMSALAASINAAGAAGCKVLLDVHNYGRYDTTPTGAGTGGVFMLGQNAPSGVTGTMNDCFADLWSRLATYFNGNAAIWGYDLCNEPHDLPAGRNDWQTASQMATEAVRLVNQNVKIAIEGYSYATVPDWTNQNGATAWMTQIIPTGQPNAGIARNNDPNILWNGHLYLDPRTNGYDGGYQDTYANELSYAQGQGFAAYTNAGYVLPATNNTLQTSLRTVFKSSFAQTADFSGTYDSINQNTNTVTIPFTRPGDTTTCMKVVASTTSDEGGVRKSLTGALNSRILQYNHAFDPATTLLSTSDLAISHSWDNLNTTDLFEVRAIGSGAGYKLLLNTIGTGAQKITGTTVFTFGSQLNLQVVVSDTALTLFVNGSSTAEVILSQSFTGKNIGGQALGKFYGGQACTMYYKTFAAGLNATYYAPPSGGLMASLPNVSVSSSVAGATAPASFSLSATASATNAGATISSVQFFEGTTSLGSVTVAPYTVSLTAVAAGTHSYTAKAVDSTGTQNLSSPVSVVVTTGPSDIPPTVSLSLSPLTATAPATTTLTANPADSDGTINLVEFYQGAVKIGQAMSSPWNLPVSGLSVGTYTFTAKATDNSGSQTVSSAQTFSSVAVVLPVPPTVSLTASASGTAPATLTLQATASSPQGVISKVDFFSAGIKIGSDTALPYSLTLVNAAAGSYSFVAVAYDNSVPALSTTSAPAILSVSGTLPAPPPPPPVLPPLAPYAAPTLIIPDHNTQELVDMVENQMGSDKGSTAIAKRDRLINRSRRRYYSAHPWTFCLLPATPLTWVQITATTSQARLPVDFNNKFDPKALYYYDPSAALQEKAFRKVDPDALASFDQLSFVYSIDKVKRILTINQASASPLLDYYYLPPDYPLDGSLNQKIYEPAPDIYTIGLLGIAMYWQGKERQRALHVQYMNEYKEALQSDIMMDAQNQPIQPLHFGAYRDYRLDAYSRSLHV